MVADSSNRPSWGSRILHAVGVVAEVGSGMAAVRDLSRVSDYLLPDDLFCVRLETRIQTVADEQSST
jgi:hypothetical protein